MKSSLVNSLQSAIRNPQSAIRSGGHYRPINIGDNERLISVAGGGALSIYGLKRGGFSGLLMTIAGGALIYRGATGHCNLYRALSVSTVKRKVIHASVKHGAAARYRPGDH